MATGGSESASDEIFNFKCTACAKRNRKREAVKYCVECQGYCCQSCVEVHQDFPALASHNLLDKSNSKSVSSTNELPAIPTERCAVHDTKIVDMYCQSHDDVGCTTCMALDHRTCTSVKSVPHIIDAVYERKAVKKILQMLKATQVSIEAFKKRNNKQIQALLKTRKEAIQEIKKFRKLMEQLLVDMEKESIHEVDNEYSKLETAIKDEVKEKEKEEDVLKKSIIDIENAEGNRAQEFVCSKIASKRVKGKEDVDQFADTEAETKLSFSVNQDILSFLKQHKTIGVVTNIKSTQYKQRKALYSVKSKREIDVRAQSEITVDIYGSCVTQDGFLVLADRYNSKLKKVDTKKATIVDQFCLTSKPWRVCCTSNDEAAVSLDNNEIQFVTLDFPMKQSRKLKMNHRCFGIAYKDDKLYITDLRNSLYIYTMSGGLLKTVSKDESGQYLFSLSRHISFSDSGDKIYVACSNNGLVSLNSQGKHIQTCKNENQSLVYDVCSDHVGYLFVCDNDLGIIKQLSQENMSDIGTVIGSSDGLHNPLSVSFNRHQCQLIVTEFQNNKVKVFDLK